MPRPTKTGLDYFPKWKPQAGYKCVKCGATDNLEIDHIISVFMCAKGHISIDKLNSYDNLAVLCKKCNAGRYPNE